MRSKGRIWNDIVEKAENLHDMQRRFAFILASELRLDCGFARVFIDYAGADIEYYFIVHLSLWESL